MPVTSFIHWESRIQRVLVKTAFSWNDQWRVAGIQQKQQQQQPPTPHQGRHQKGPAPDRPAQHIQDGRRDAAPPRRQQQQPQVLQQQQQQQRQQQQQHVPREREPARGRGRQARMSPGISPTSSQPENLATPNMSTPLSSPPSPRTEMANQINEQIIAQQNEELPPDEVPTKEVNQPFQFPAAIMPGQEKCSFAKTTNLWDAAEQEAESRENSWGNSNSKKFQFSFCFFFSNFCGQFQKCTLSRLAGTSSFFSWFSSWLHSISACKTGPVRSHSAASQLRRLRRVAERRRDFGARTASQGQERLLRPVRAGRAAAWQNVRKLLYCCHVSFLASRSNWEKTSLRSARKVPVTLSTMGTTDSQQRGNGNIGSLLPPVNSHPCDLTLTLNERKSRKLGEKHWTQYTCVLNWEKQTTSHNEIVHIRQFKHRT